MGGSGSGNRTYSTRPGRKLPDVNAEDVDQNDLLEQARKDFKRFGAVTREDRIALASRFVRSSDPMISLQYSKFMEAMESSVDSAETGLPPPTTIEQQSERLSRLMQMVGKPTTDQAYESFLKVWRQREVAKENRYRSEPQADVGAYDPDQRLAADPDPDPPEPMSELPGTEADHSDTEGAQPPPEAGEPATTPEAGRTYPAIAGGDATGLAEAPAERRPAVAPNERWKPLADSVRYVDNEDGSDDPDTY